MFSETELETIEDMRDADTTDDTDDNAAATVTGTYTPVFNDTVRTVVYVVCLCASVIGLGFMCFGSADIGGYLSTAAGVIAAGFGVAYNPVRMNG